MVAEVSRFNPLDFFLWGYLKGKIFWTKPIDMGDLKHKVIQEKRLTIPEVVKNVQKEFIDR